MSRILSQTNSYHSLALKVLKEIAPASGERPEISNEICNAIRWNYCIIWICI